MRDSSGGVSAVRPVEIYDLESGIDEEEVIEPPFLLDGEEGMDE